MAFFVEELKQAFKPVNESCEYSKPYNDAKKSADKKAKEKVEAKSPEKVKINPTGPAKEDNTSKPVDEGLDAVGAVADDVGNVADGIGNAAHAVSDVVDDITESVELKEGRRLNEGPGAGYEIKAKAIIRNWDSIKLVDVQQDKYSQIATITGTCSVDFSDLSAWNYYNGLSWDDLYAEESIGNVQLTGSVQVDDWTQEGENIEDCLEEIAKYYQGMSFDIDYTYGGGWSHSTFDGTLADKRNPIYIGYYGEFQVFEFKLVGNDDSTLNIIDFIDYAGAYDGSDDYFEESLNLTEMQKYKEKTGEKYPDKRMVYPHEDSKEAAKFYKKRFGKDNGFARGYAKVRDHESNTPQFLPNEDSLKDAQEDIRQFQDNKAMKDWSDAYASGEKEIPAHMYETPKDFEKNSKIYKNRNDRILNKHRALRGKNESVKRVSAMSLLEGYQDHKTKDTNSER